MIRGALIRRAAVLVVVVVVVAVVGLMAAGCGGSKSPTSAADYCDLTRKLDQDINFGASTDYKASFVQFDSVAAQYLAAVPPAVKDDANTVIADIRQLETTLRAVNFDITKADANSLKSLSEAKFTTALNRLVDYNSKTCGTTTATTPTT